MRQPDSTVVIDTSVFVAAGFRPKSAAGRLVQAVRDGRVRMRWSDATRAETETVLSKIPRLSWPDVEPLFRDDDRCDGPLDEHDLDWVPDPTDRKFAALARATDAILVSNDQHFLARRDEATIIVLASGEFRDRLWPA